MLLLPLILWWGNCPTRFARGRCGRVLCTLVILAILAGLPPTGCPADELVAVEDSIAPMGIETDRRYREGTTVPRTDGRIVLLGRRYAFVPGGRSLADGARTPDGSAVLDSNIRNNDQPTILVRRPMMDRPTIRKTGSTGLEPISDATDRSATTQGSPLLLVENLMLQRIVESMRVDPADDRWTLGGEMLEFFDGNRLLIRTAQRSNRVESVRSEFTGEAKN